MDDFSSSFLCWICMATLGVSSWFVCITGDFVWDCFVYCYFLCLFFVINLTYYGRHRLSVGRGHPFSGGIVLPAETSGWYTTDDCLNYG